MAVKPIPEGYHSVTPYLIVDGAAAALDFHVYGDRSGNLVDPFGHRWTIATHVEDVSPEEMRRRMAAWDRANAG